MNRAVFLLAVAIGLVAPIRSMASQEGVLPIGELRVSSPGIGESGPVTVIASRRPNGFSALEVEAFGRVARLTTEQLAKLSGQFVNGVQLSYDSGDTHYGGRTVYVLLSKGFTSGRQEMQLISVNEQGAVTVEPPTRGSP